MKAITKFHSFFPNGDEYKLVPVNGDELDFIHPNTGVQNFVYNEG